MRLRREDGMTLVELLIGASLMLVVMFATLTAMDGLLKVNSRTTKLIDTVDTTRNAMSRLTRDLRDATASTPTATGGESVITRADPQDLVMRRINPFATGAAGNVTGAQTVRWCLQAANGTLYRQVAEGVAAPGAACPHNGAGWTTTVQGQDVSNGPRAVFTYDNTILTDITSVKTFLAIDRNPLKAPNETTLESGVFLRNQNRKPIAAFSYVVLGGRSIQLNAQASRDPEGGMLTYKWVDNGQELPYTGAVASYVAPQTGPRQITLSVQDVDKLTASISQMVDVK